MSAQSPRAESESSSRHLHLHHHHHNMSRKNESVAWRAFVKLGGNKVICRICNKQMNYQSGSSTSNMVKHLQAVHKHILADAKPSNIGNPQPAPPAAPASCKGSDRPDDLSTTPLSNEPWMVLQNAPAHLRQRWQDLKLGLQKEMQQHQQAVAWSVIGQPCLGAPAGADLLTDSDASPAYWSGSGSNNSISHSHGSGVTPTSRDSSPPETGSDWQRRETEQSSETTSYQYRVKMEPIETDEILEQAPERPESVSSPPLALSPPPRSPSPIVICASAPDGSSEPPPSDQNDGPPPPKNKKHKSSQTNLQPPSDPSPAECPAELELRLNGLRRAQERAEELHHEHLRESRARAEAAQAERDHRLQLIRHAEEIHLQNLEAQRQALEHSRQLHEMSMRQTLLSRARSISAFSELNGSLSILPTPKTIPSICTARSVSVSSFRHFHCTRASFNIVPFNLSDIGEGITEVTVKEWFVNVGDKVVQFDNICEVQSDKASVTITSRYDGVIAKLHYKVDDTAKVGFPLVDIEMEGEGSVSDSTDTEKEPSSDSDEEVRTSEMLSSHGKALATPAVRRIAGEHKIDISLIKGSGKSGRVMKEDIMAYISDKQTSTVPSTSGAQLNNVPPKAVHVGNDRTVPICGITKAMVRSMTAANAVPHFVYSDEVDVGALIEMRLKLKEAAEKQSIKLSYMPFFLKAASLALNQYPILNASVNADCTEVTYKARHNIGFAFDSPSGLIVPNIKDVQSLQLFDIAREMDRIISAGRKGPFPPHDVTGGTFTLSNIGSIGGTYMKPVLLLPEVVIGALGRFQKLPRFGKTGAIEEANIMCISWAADHRVVDGATVARFSNMFKELIENPVELLVQ